jgi:hypothetical protein
METHENDPEHRKDEQDILGKMMNMIMSLREELGNLWTKNAVLEKELSVLRPREDAVCDSTSTQGEQSVLCDHEGDREEALEPSAYEGDGGKAVSSVDDVCAKVKCVHCDAETEKDKSCCNKPACEECDKFGKWAKGEKVD